MRDYDSTVARIAGNILSGASLPWTRLNNIGVNGLAEQEEWAIARGAVIMARVIVAETRATQPEADLTRELLQRMFDSPGIAPLRDWKADIYCVLNGTRPASWPIVAKKETPDGR